ncbi:MAG: endonuclease III [Thermoleophilia bacterium]
MVTPARLPLMIKFLDREYFRPRWAPRYPPTEELVFTILSQNTTDINAGRALESLKKKYPDWEKVSRAPETDIAAAIRSGGLADTKARYIKTVLAGILAEQGDLTLDFLNDMDSREVIEYLTAYPGVGVKTASCVLMFALGRPVMPVDTHVFRLGKRLDFLPEDATRKSAHVILNAIVPQDDKFALHINLVLHGRKICKAGRPLCDECVIEPFCPSAIVE